MTYDLKENRKARLKQLWQSKETLATSASQVTAENKMGWALKQSVASVRFNEKVREYLIAKFDAGEKSGRKANPGDVEMEMRNSREENNCRRFTCEEWLMSTQIKSFFSCLAAARRKAWNMQTQESTQELLPEDKDLINEREAGAEEENRRKS